MSKNGVGDLQRLLMHDFKASLQLEILGLVYIRNAKF